VKSNGHRLKLWHICIVVVCAGTTRYGRPCIRRVERTVYFVEVAEAMESETSSLSSWWKWIRSQWISLTRNIWLLKLVKHFLFLVPSPSHLPYEEGVHLGACLKPSKEFWNNLKKHFILRGSQAHVLLLFQKISMRLFGKSTGNCNSAACRDVARSARNRST